MVFDPKKQDNRLGPAGSLFFFIVAILVIAFGAVIERLQGTAPLQINGNILLLLLLLGLVLLIYRLSHKPG